MENRNRKKKQTSDPSARKEKEDWDVVFPSEEARLSIQDPGPSKATNKDASEGKKLLVEAKEEVGSE